MADSNSELGSPSELFVPKRPQTRRAHKKSRNGCLACKEQRKKCDERAPSCSRCARLRQPCIYNNTMSDVSTDEHGADERPDKLTVPTLSARSSRHSGSDASGLSTPAETSLRGATPTLHPATIDVPQLSFVDMDLFNHFLTHTSRMLQPEPESQYAWRVGIPNLAFRSSVLMHSILAVSAACLCVDRFSDPICLSSGLNYDGVVADTANADPIAEMYNAAISHHEQSLQLTSQAVSAGAMALDPDIVIVNAYLMVPFAVISRRVQRWQQQSKQLLEQSGPLMQTILAQSSWVSPIRAVQEAVWGLRTMIKESDAQQQPSSSEPMDMSTPDKTSDEPFAPSVFEHGLCGYVLMTAPKALSDLEARLNALSSQTPDSAAAAACRAAFGEVRQISDDLGTAFHTPMALCTICNDQNCTHKHPQGYVAGVAPWIQDWLLRHGHTRSSQEQGLPRRILTFINRVPSEFWTLVDGPLERDVLAATNSDESLAAAQHLALEIFAHWLVFVLLLDGIWCVGDLGAQELQQTICLLGGPEAISGWSSEWWPATMLELACGLKDSKID